MANDKVPQGVAIFLPQGVEQPNVGAFEDYLLNLAQADGKKRGLTYRQIHSSLAIVTGVILGIIIDETYEGDE